MRKAKIIKCLRAENKYLADRLYHAAVMVNGRKRWQATDLARKIVSCTIPGGRAL